MSTKSKTEKPVVYLGTDHAGRALKDLIKDHLVKKGYHVHDVGAFSDESSDYPDFIIPACESVARSGSAAMGIVFGGSGNGEAMAANKVTGIRCAVVYDTYTAKLSREHNDANVMSLGSRTKAGKPATAKKLVDLWLATKFSGDERHVRRLKKVSAYEKRGKSRKRKA
jgi:ribose 5-phosphate isomerase B